MKTVLTFKVTLTQPPGSSMRETQDFVKDAILSYVGNLGTEVALANLDRDSVRVAIYERQVKY